MPKIDVRRFATRSELDAALADRLERGDSRHRDASRRRPPVIMLSGGHTPLPAYREVARRRPRTATSSRIIYSDDRYVPVDSDASNYHATRPLIDALGLPEESGAARQDRAAARGGRERLREPACAPCWTPAPASASPCWVSAPTATPPRSSAPSTCNSPAATWPSPSNAPTACKASASPPTSWPTSPSRSSWSPAPANTTRSPNSSPKTQIWSPSRRVRLPPRGALARTRRRAIAAPNVRGPNAREGLARKFLWRGASGSRDAGREPPGIGEPARAGATRIHGVPAPKEFTHEARSPNEQHLLRRELPHRQVRGRARSRPPLRLRPRVVPTARPRRAAAPPPSAPRSRTCRWMAHPPHPTPDPRSPTPPPPHPAAQSATYRRSAPC